MGTGPRAGYSPAPISQMAFFFVTDEERQAQDEVYRMLTSARQRMQRSSKPQPLPDIRIDLLAPPLVLLANEHGAPQVEDLQEDPLVADDHASSVRPTALAGAVGDEDAEVEQLSVDELTQKAEDIQFMADRPLEFLDWLLQRNLRYLASRGNPVEKKSVIEWIFAPAVDGSVYDFRPGGAGREIPLITKRLPFSFEWICIHLGLCPDTIRQELLLALQRAQAEAQGSKSATLRSTVELARAMEHA